MPIFAAVVKLGTSRTYSASSSMWNPVPVGMAIAIRVKFGAFQLSEAVSLNVPPNCIQLMPVSYRVIRKVRFPDRHCPLLLPSPTHKLICCLPVMSTPAPGVGSPAALGRSTRW